MGTKSNPGKHDCYAKAEEDEPMFTLLARDPTAASCVRHWVMSNIGEISHEKREEALRCARDMDVWQQEWRSRKTLFDKP